MDNGQLTMDNEKEVVMSDDVNVRLILNDKKSEILFYDEVNDKSVLVLNDYLGQAIDNSISIADKTRVSGMKRLEDTTGEVLNVAVSLPPVLLRINSNGGTWFDGLAVVDYIKRSTVPIHTVVDGFCASTATIISIAGHRRFINKNSFMLLHQLSGSSNGTLKQMKYNFESDALLMDRLIDFYLAHTNIKRKNLKRLLDKDLYLTSDKCLKYGLVDEVI